MNATYSPEDNKLRLYAPGRLDSETYARVRAAGFVHAPRQECFVAPRWTPDREDLLRELCGEIGDEDTTLAERAEQRAERFESYGERRTGEAERAQAAVRELAGVTLGQPVLAGHHSERHARRDAERIHTGMAAAVRLWDTAEYWTLRARAAIRHAMYKEQPAVRHRRIKGLEADRRRHEKSRAAAETFLRHWSAEDLTPERARALANHHHGSYRFPLSEYPRDLPASQYEGEMGLWSALDSGIITAARARDLAVPGYQRSIARDSRWIAHLENRLAYERAMLEEQGGIVADRKLPEKGGACRCWATPRGAWSPIHRVNRVSVTIKDNWGNGGRDFTRTIPFGQLTEIMSREEVDSARAAGRLAECEGRPGFFLVTPAEPGTGPAQPC